MQSLVFTGRPGKKQNCKKNMEQGNQKQGFLHNERNECGNVILLSFCNECAKTTTKKKIKKKSQHIFKGTFGTCPRPVFSFGVSQRRSCEIIMEKKTPFSPEVVYFKTLDFATSSVRSRNQFNY